MATLGLFLGLDVLVAYVVEPIVIGAKTGVSSMAMLVSAIFWSWLWGPVGLVLSTPLTVCLAVLGKHVPRLSSLAVLLDDQPALEDQLVLYHRLLSGDEEEAQEILDKRFREKTRGAGLRRDHHPRAAPRRSRSRPRRDQRGRPPARRADHSRPGGHRARGAARRQGDRASVEERRRHPAGSSACRPGR